MGISTIGQAGIVRASQIPYRLMEPLVFTPTYELFLVLEPLCDSFGELVTTLEPLDGSDGPALLAADLYYRESTDVCLLALRFDERTLSYAALTWVLDLATGAGLPALDPARLGDTDRRTFYDGYLADYDVRVENSATVREALYDLGRRLDLVSGVVEPPTIRRARTATGPSGRVAPPSPRPPRLPTAPEVVREGTRPMPDEVVPPAAHARMNRLGSSPPAPAPQGRGALGKLSPAHRSPARRQELSLVEQAALARSRAAQRASTVRGALLPDEAARTDVDPIDPAAPPDRDEPRRAQGKGKQRRRTMTTPATPVAKRAGSTPPPMPGPTEPLQDPLAPPAIDVQFLRGGHWVPARLRSLSSRGAYLVTGAPPRVGDQVHVALDFDDASAMVRGTVHHVTTPDDAVSTGSSGFAVRFPQIDSPARRSLVAMLKRARSAGVTIKPPPARLAVRFPVKWPVRVGTRAGGFGADALDVSTGGLFVATGRDLSDDELVFRLPLDNDDSAICGRARIARAVDTDMATSRGLARGYGLRILELSDGDSRRYESFLERVRRRTDKRIVVGAGPDRMRALCGGLTAVGYSVTSSSDPGVLVRLADLEPRAPDAAIIDDSLAEIPSRRSLLEQAFGARQVPCLSTGDEAPQRARAVIDRLLCV